MKRLDDEKLMTIEGGLSISGAIINSITSGIKVFLDLGRSFGTALRRVMANKTCKM